MGRAKEIVVKVIPSSIANPFMRTHHYSGKVVNNSSLHFGVFLDDNLHGVMSFGPSLDKSKIIGLVQGTLWHEFLELNRMAFDEYLPKFSESRAISLALKLIKAHAPHIKWIISFADGCSCGDGTIYRASNFILTGIKANESLALLPNGEKIHKMSIQASPTQKRQELGNRSLYDITGGRCSWTAYLQEARATLLSGYQFRYIYFLDKTYRARLTVPEIPFSRIDELGAGMYKGETISIQKRREGVERTIPGLGDE